MFQWDKSITSIDIPANKVLHLFRSMREVQLALPGVSSQQASSFLCQYQDDGGIATVAVFHLHKSKVLSFYFSDPRVVSAEKTDSMLDQGLTFVESMGFLMTDQDIHLLDAADQEMLWASLPMKSGLIDEDEPSPAEEPSAKQEKQPVAKASGGKAPKVKPTQKVVQETVPMVESRKVVEAAEAEVVAVKHAKVATPKPEEEPEPSENVDDLLAAVDAMRAKRPGLRARKSAPTVEEMASRRLKLRETIGRILASL